MKKRVAVAMSGGVDSGVAAALVVKAGYQAAGFHMRLWQESHLRGGAGFKPRGHLGGVFFENKCCSTESLEAARKTAHQVGIPFYIVDFEEIFKKRVVDYFLKEYGLGRTPNPCIRCNRFIKFGELLYHAKKLGYDYLATGHYARVVEVTSDQRPATRENKNRSLITGYRLLQGVDKSKDQSYFLYNLTQKQLAQVMFPVGDYLKKKVVKMAKKWKLPVAERPESQEICFFPETDYRPFLRRQIKGKIIPGEIVDTKGKVIGKHKGIPLYTIGQRHGFEIESGVRSQESGVIPPYYVIAKDVKKNQLIVGFGKEAERKEFWVRGVNWIDSLTARRLPLNAKVRIRHQGELLDCRVKREMQDVRRKTGGNVSRITYHVSLTESERGIAPGQAAAFYKKLETGNSKLETRTHEVLGGGIIAIDKRE